MSRISRCFHVSLVVARVKRPGDCKHSPTCANVCRLHRQCLSDHGRVQCVYLTTHAMARPASQTQPCVQSINLTSYPPPLTHALQHLSVARGGAAPDYSNLDGLALQATVPHSSAETQTERVDWMTGQRQLCTGVRAAAAAAGTPRSVDTLSMSDCNGPEPCMA